MEGHVSPGDLSPAERLDAVAEILSRGVARVLAAAADGAAAPQKDEPDDETEPEAR